jgi:hypothetical protein
MTDVQNIRATTRRVAREVRGSVIMALDVVREVYFGRRMQI